MRKLIARKRSVKKWSATDRLAKKRPGEMRAHPDWGAPFLFVAESRGRLFTAKKLFTGDAAAGRLA